MNKPPQSPGKPIPTTMVQVQELAAGKPKEKKSSQSTLDKCDLCTSSFCCNYITEPIETPRSIKDFDTLLWQVSHENIHCFKDDDGWFLVSMGKCEHLQHDGRCGIYQTRPFICREHSNVNCEYDRAQESGCEYYFKNSSELNAYCKNRFKSWENRFK